MPSFGHPIGIRLAMGLILSLLLFGCTEDPAGPGGFLFPCNPSPADAEHNVVLPTKLAWSFDPGKDSLETYYFKVYLGTTPNPPQIATITATVCYPGMLSPNTDYFWRVLAYTPTGKSVSSPVWRFTTGAEYVFPLEIGNTWQYYKTSATINITPDSLADYPGIIHDMPVTARSTITGRQVLGDTLDLYLVTTSWRAQFSTGRQSEYVYATPRGLYLYYSTGGGWSGPPKSAAPGEVYYEFHGRRFSGPDQLADFLSPGNDLLIKTTVDNPYLYRKLAYPVNVGQHWAYSNGTPWQIEKEVVGFNRIDVPAGSFECYKIQWFWDIDGDGRWDTDLIGYDYLFPGGLAYREFTFKNVVVIDYTLDTLGFVDIKDEYRLTGYQIF